MSGVHVRCHSGRTYAERPASFAWHGEQHEVKAIEREWLEPGERHFWVRTEGAKAFHVYYREREDTWLLAEL